MNSKLWWGIGLAAFALFMIVNGTSSPLHPVLLLVGIVLIVLGFQDRSKQLRNDEKQQS